MRKRKPEHHRSKRLALESARRFERKSGLKLVKLERRNRFGHFSPRGRSFTFVFEEEEVVKSLSDLISIMKKPGLIIETQEWHASADYKRKRT